jgi:hypothetical protein
MIYPDYYTTSNIKGIKMRLIERTAKFKKEQAEKAKQVEAVQEGPKEEKPKRVRKTTKKK